MYCLRYLVKIHVPSLFEGILYITGSIFVNGIMFVINKLLSIPVDMVIIVETTFNSFNVCKSDGYALSLSSR